MKTFIPTSDKTFYFSNCNSCDAKCCNGKHGTLFAQIILNDFEKIYKNFPIVFIKGELGYLKPVVLLTNGENHCRYVKEFKCSIYENRPSICQVYPLSINIDDNYYIDCNCPAVEEEGQIIIKNREINSNFYNDILDNYKDKYIQTHFEFDNFNKEENLELAININNITFYKFNNHLENPYIKLHLDSLKNLDDYYFKT